MPNPPKPIERKRRTGNPGQRKLPPPATAIPAITNLPEPLRPLSPEGTKAWNRIWESGTHWISGLTDVQVVQLLCESEDERLKLRYVVWNDLGDWRDRVALRSLDTFILSIYSLLGFNPTDRTRLGVGEVKEMTIVDELRARRNS